MYFSLIIAKEIKMDSKTVLAISRLASTLDVESAKSELGPGVHKIEDALVLTGEVTLGEKYFSQDTAISWQTVVGYLLANLGDNRASVRRKLINAIRLRDPGKFTRTVRKTDANS
jgi:hypothetical protein